MQARALPARHGVVWLMAGFHLFRRNPPLLTGLTLSYLLLVILVNVLPTIGPVILPLLLPALTGILGNGCRAVESGRPPSFAMLAAGLGEQRIPMLRLGLLHLAGSSLLVLASLALGNTLDLSDGLSETEAMAMLQELSLLLVLATPLIMAFWFSPLLTLWDGVPATKSVFFSFVASVRNWRPFAMYGLAVALVGIMVPGLLLVIAGLISGALANILSVALRMLMLFVLAPVLVASIYLSYRDVFHTPPLDVLVNDE